MKIRPLEAGFSHVDRRTKGHKESNNRNSQFCENT